ncbi:hypothetical protein ACWDTI_18865 [Gordonia sp. NPDC003424]
MSERKTVKSVRGSVEDALQPAVVELLETDPEEFVRKTRRPRFGFVSSKADRDKEN